MLITSVGFGQKIENLVGWANEEVHTTIPDLICMIDTDSGLPVTSPNFFNGQNIAVIVLPAPEAFASPKGLEAFGASYAGGTIPYQASVANG